MFTLYSNKSPLVSYKTKLEAQQHLESLIKAHLKKRKIEKATDWYVLRKKDKKVEYYIDSTEADLSPNSRYK